MAAELRHVSFLLELQEDANRDHLKECVCNFDILTTSNFHMLNQVFKAFNPFLLTFQGWPHTDISPIGALLTMFAAERCLGQEISKQGMTDSSLQHLLIPEDFEKVADASF